MIGVIQHEASDDKTDRVGEGTISEPLRLIAPNTAAAKTRVLESKIMGFSPALVKRQKAHQRWAAVVAAAVHRDSAATPSN